MASGLSTPLGIAGIISVVIGIIMALIGIILLIVNQNTEKPWYIWVLLVGGVILGIIGGVLLAIALAEKPTLPPYARECKPYAQECVPSTGVV